MEASRSIPPPAAPCRLLLVDDDPVLCRAITRVMGKESAVTTATSVDQGLGYILDGQPFDLILCDMAMPEKSGMDFHVELGRHRPALLDRLVFFTGGASTREARQFLQRVPNERLAKPGDVMAQRDLARRFARID